MYNVWEEGIILTICSSIRNREIRTIMCVIVRGGMKEKNIFRDIAVTVHKLIHHILTTYAHLSLMCFYVRTVLS